MENILYVRELKHNLISISQLYDRGLKVLFELFSCLVTNPLDNSNIFIDHRQDNIYLIDMDDIDINGHCLVASKANIDEDSWLWHRRLGHASSHLISKLIKNNLVNGLLNLNLESNLVCKAYQLGKHTRTSFKPKNIVTTTRPLELLHLDLLGPLV